MPRARRADLTSEELKEIVALYASGIPGTDIARKYRITVSAIYRQLGKAGVSVNQPGANRLSPETVDEIPTLYEKHGTLKKTAEAMGVHFGTIHLHLHRNDPKKSRKRKGPVTPAEKRRVLRLYEEHGTYAAVWRETGITLPTITRIVKENAGD